AVAPRERPWRNAAAPPRKRHKRPSPNGTQPSVTASQPPASLTCSTSTDKPSTAHLNASKDTSHANHHLPHRRSRDPFSRRVRRLQERPPSHARTCAHP